MAHIRQPRQVSGLGLKVTLKPFQVFPARSNALREERSVCRDVTRWEMVPVFRYVEAKLFEQPNSFNEVVTGEIALVRHAPVNP